MAVKPHWASENRVPSVALEQQVVAAGDHFPARPAHDSRAAGQPGAEREPRSHRALKLSALNCGNRQLPTISAD
jgi:hypothetical protein